MVVKEVRSQGFVLYDSPFRRKQKQQECIDRTNSDESWVHLPKRFLGNETKLSVKIRTFKKFISPIDTPWKINMEPPNHPFRKENDLNQTSMIMAYGTHVNLQGCTERKEFEIFESRKLPGLKTQNDAEKMRSVFWCQKKSFDFGVVGS